MPTPFLAIEAAVVVAFIIVLMLAIYSWHKGKSKTCITPSCFCKSCVKYANCARWTKRA